MKYIEYQNEYQTECERESSKMTAYLKRFLIGIT